jgi:prepilin-type N-terminal cleavage/methylation domain-containing protein
VFKAKRIGFCFKKWHMKIGREQGVTLVELLIVLAIATILVVAMGFEFQGWMGRYKTESQIKQMYVDIMNTRARAMQRNRFHMIVLTANTYTVYEDMNENEAVDAATEELPGYPKTIDNYTMTWTGGGNTITFNTRGLVVPPTRTIRVLTSVDADYDCMTVLDTKTNMGKWDGTVCQPK